MKLNIIGRGNVASHLIKAFEGKCDVYTVNPRTLEGLNPDADVTLICVSDTAIPSVVADLPECYGILAHTSGSTDMSVFKDRKESHGVFYPLQTFTKGKPIDYTRIPFFIEADSENTASVLRNLAHMVSGSVYDADSEKRRNLHVASVFACNFVNHLWSIADDYLQDNGLDFSVLLPLIEETSAKIKSVPPADAQTGPASRGDVSVIKNHLRMLSDDPAKQELYRILSDSIMKAKGIDPVSEL